MTCHHKGPKSEKPVGRHRWPHRSLLVSSHSVILFVLGRMANFSKCLWRWGHLMWPGDQTLDDLGFKFPLSVQNQWWNRYNKFCGATSRSLFRDLPKTEGRVPSSPTPTPVSARVNLTNAYILEEILNERNVHLCPQFWCCSAWQHLASASTRPGMMSSSSHRATSTERWWTVTAFGLWSSMHHGVATAKVWCPITKRQLLHLR